MTISLHFVGLSWNKLVLDHSATCWTHSCREQASGLEKTLEIVVSSENFHIDEVIYHHQEEPWAQLGALGYSHGYFSPVWETVTIQLYSLRSISQKVDNPIDNWRFGAQTNSLRSKRFRAVSEQRKTEERDSRFWPREKGDERQKMKEGGGGGEGRKRLQTNPSILKTCVRWRTQVFEPDWLGYLTCVDQRFVPIWWELEFNMPEELDVVFEAALQKALNFLSERGFNRELRQEQKSSVKQLFTGGDLLAVLPTGFGKSFIFQLLALVNDDHVVLVIFRLKSIVNDQIKDQIICQRTSI